MESALRTSTNKHVRFDPLLSKEEEQRQLEKKKRLEISYERTKTKCRNLFLGMIDPSNRVALVNALGTPPRAEFPVTLRGFLDDTGVPVPANADDFPTRLQSITVAQIAAFDTNYDNNTNNFREWLRTLVFIVEKNGGELLNVVTPPNSPGRGAGGGGNAGGGDGGAGGASPAAVV